MGDGARIWVVEYYAAATPAWHPLQESPCRSSAEARALLAQQRRLSRAGRIRTRLRIARYIREED